MTDVNIACFIRISAHRQSCFLTSSCTTEHAAQTDTTSELGHVAHHVTQPHLETDEPMRPPARDASALLFSFAFVNGLTAMSKNTSQTSESLGD